ncbi:MAG: hypothetical protein WCE63_02740 [Acidobacteriaceae bacterium]
MNWRKFWQGVGALLLALVPAIVAPWVGAKMEGLPLNGLPGILLFWNTAIQHKFSFETWQAALFLLSIVCLALIFRRYRKRQAKAKVGLNIVVIDSPPPSWYIGAVGKVPTMYVHFHAQLAHTGPRALRIVKIYLKGTDCVASFPPIVVTGSDDESVQVHTGVRPILSNNRQGFTRRAILVDQFGNKHQTEPICFQPSANPIPHALTPMGCHFCGQPVAMKDLAESAALFAHKKCVR